MSKLRILVGLLAGGMASLLVVATTYSSAGAAAPVKAAASCSSAIGEPVAHAVASTVVNPGGCPGYYIASAAGAVSGFGAAVPHGDTSGMHLNQPIVGMAATPDGGGYWLVARDGGIFSFGNAHFYGSVGGQHLNQPIVGMAATPDGGGYWFVAADGGIFSFGNARFSGSMGGQHLNQPIVGMAATPDGGGYWLVARDGGIFSFGNAHFYGSTGGQHLNQPIVGMAATPDGGGYWFVAADGGIFSFGNARFYGSTGGQPLSRPIVSMGAAGSGGYRLVASDGGIFTFGDAPFLGAAMCPAIDPGVYGVNPDTMANTGGGSQLITEIDPASNSLSGILTAWNASAGGCWSPVSFAGQPAQPYPAETGYGGIKPFAQRVENDGSTPSGLFGIGAMYGVSPYSPTSSYPYTHLVCGDWWDELPGSPTYDTFQVYPCGATPPFTSSAEALWTETVAYQHFVDIITPDPPQNSGGIFLHDDTTAGDTAGCIALPPAELDAVLGWMNPADSPHMAIGIASNIAAL